MGLPVACQDMVTYKNALIKFKTGEEMMFKIEDTLRRTNRYLENSHAYRKIGENRFLEKNENHECYVEMFTTPYGSTDRKCLNKFNNSI